MGTEIYLGQPPECVKKWILDKDLPAGGWTEVVKALEAGDITSGTLNGITFGGNAITIGSSMSTPIAYYQGTDGEIIDTSEWIVCGFNGAVPEYVKYIMNGTQRVFVKATDDSDVERAIAAGDSVFTRKWNTGTSSYDYTKLGVVESLGSETFTYGATNADYGTTAIKDAYSVPKSMTVKLDGTDKKLEAKFAGYNMQLWSKHTYLDADAAGSYEAAKAMMADSKQCTTMSFGSSQNWATSHVRGFLNGTSKPSGYVWTNAPSGLGRSSYAVKHTFIEKAAANEDALLQAVCKQVNRNWQSGDSIVRTVDTFWLPGCDITKSIGWNSSAYKDVVNGLCEEAEFSKHMKPAFVNGCAGYYSLTYCWLRSAYADYSYAVAILVDGDAGTYDYGRDYVGFSPACSIG